MATQASPTETPPVVQNNPNWSPSFNKAFEQWEAEQAKYGADFAFLQGAIAKMLEEMNTGHTAQAYEMAQNVIMPATLRLQGDSMAQLAASMNLASALQGSLTNAENTFNTAVGKKSITTAEAKAFIASLKHIYAEVQSALFLKIGGHAHDWLGGGTAGNILSALKQICGQFGVSNPNDLHESDVRDTTNAYLNHMTTPYQGQTGQQWVQNLQAGITQTTNSISSQSQGLQAQEQFAANFLTQILNTDKAIFQATQKQNQVFVQNQKG